MLRIKKRTENGEGTVKKRTFFGITAENRDILVLRKKRGDSMSRENNQNNKNQQNQSNQNQQNQSNQQNQNNQNQQNNKNNQFNSRNKKNSSEF